MYTKSVIGILLMCCLVVNCLKRQACPEFYEAVGGKCYQMHLNDKNNWYEATRFCKRDDAELLSIESLAEMDKVVEFLKKSQPGVEAAESVWTAGTDLGSLGSFYWQSNGKDFEYSKWIKYQPEFKGHKHCVKLSWDETHDYHMRNSDCKDSLAFVCEMNAAIDFESN